MEKTPELVHRMDEDELLQRERPGRSCGEGEGRKIRAVSKRHVRFSVDRSQTQRGTQTAPSVSPAVLHRLVIPAL